VERIPEHCVGATADTIVAMQTRTTGWRASESGAAATRRQIASSWRLLWSAAALALAPSVASALDCLPEFPLPVGIESQRLGDAVVELVASADARSLRDRRRHVEQSLSAAAPRADRVAIEVALVRALCARWRADAALGESEKRRRIAEFHAQASAAPDARAVPASLGAIGEVVVWLRSAADHPADATLAAELLIEGERVAGASARGVPSGVGELQSLALRPTASIPSRTCRDLELDFRLAAGERASFAIEAVELRTESGASALTLFEQPGIVALDTARRGLSLAARGDACPE
jgi:hypothetical protein